MFFIDAALLLFATESLPQPIVEARPTVYSHLPNPSLYQDYTRRPSRAPTWATLTDKLNLVFARPPVLSAARVTAVEFGGGRSGNARGLSHATLQTSG